MVQLDEKIVVIAVPRNVEIFRSQPEGGLKRVDAGDIGQDHRVIEGVLASSLAFIIAEEKCAVSFERSAQRKAKLVLVQLVETRRGQHAGGIESIVAKIFVRAAVNVIGAALGDDIHNAADGAPGLHAVGVVDHSEFAYRFFRGRSLLHPRSGRDVVCPVNRNEVVVDVLAGKGKLGHRFNDYVGAAGGGIAHDHSRSQQGEI